MNQHIHKVIFNKTTGRMDVVSEIVSAQGGATLASANEHPHPAWHHSITQFLIKPVAFALMLSLGTAQILPAQAQVIADPSAPKSQQPTVLPTASGATQINIQTPSAAGVSMNQYRQFDTQTNGTVLNNSRTNTNTQTAGWIQANPWLATGSARVIVNQVNSSNPSRLTGNIEVAGQRADLVIANPSGININGAAIINAKRTTFTTGAPQLNNGNLTGYQVNQGQINIEGTGLNATGSDYTDLLARAVKVNAGIWANNLAITTGANSINVDNSQFTVNTATGTTPSLAIDTSALGGMYAGKITLIGTENGVGVNNAGQIAASAGNVTIDANGMLSNSGTINSNGAENATQIKSTQLANTGSISSQGNTQIQTANLTNSGTIAAGREAKLTATDLNNSTGTINGQRIDITANSLNNTQGNIQQTGAQALALNAGSISNLNNGLIGYEPLDSGSGTGSTGTGTGSTGTGTTTPPSTATGGGSSSVVQPTPVVLADGQINVQSHLNNDAGRITANGGIDLTASNGLENHATLSLNKLTVTGDSLDNSSGTITSTQLTANTTNINNTAGKMGSMGNTALTSQTLDNTAGQITAGGIIKATVAQNLSNQTGVIASNGALTVDAGTLNNNGGSLVSNTGNAHVVSAGGLTSVGGTIQAANTLLVRATGINNNQGRINGLTTQVDAGTQALNNQAGTIAGTDVSVSSGAITNDTGLIQGSHSVTIDSHGQALSNTNSGTTGGIISGGTLAMTVGDLNNAAGIISNSSEQTIQANQINNTSGQIIAGTTLQVDAQNLVNTHGHLNAGDSLAGNVAQTVSNSEGTIASNGMLTLKVGTLNNDNGQVASAKSSATINSTNSISNVKGSLQAATVLNVNGNGLDNTDGLVNGATVAVNSQSQILTNTRGQLTGNEVTVDSGILNNDAGLIQGSQSLAINTHGQTLTNSNSGSAGGIVSGGVLSIHSGDLKNSLGASTSAELSTAGYIAGNGSTSIVAAQIDNNSQGQIISQSDLDITATGVTNISGSQIQALGNTHIALGGGTLNNNEGLIRSGASTDIKAGDVINTNTNGTDLVTGLKAQGIQGNSLAINAANLNNSEGVILASRNAGITATGTLDNTRGLISANQALTVQDPNVIKTLSVINTEGRIIGDAGTTVNAKSLTGDGTVISAQDVTLNVTDDFIVNKVVQAGNNLSLTSAGNITNHGQIIAGNTNTVSAQNIDNTANAEISSAKTQLTANDTLTNRGLIDGGDTFIQANTVNNVGTGRIYGDHIAIGATTLNNIDEVSNGVDTTATIAARSRLDIGAQTINNQVNHSVTLSENSTLFSGDDLAIGGGLDANHLATGQASVLNNVSSTIESTGDMQLSAGQINNTNAYFASEIQVVKQERVGEVQGTIASEVSPTPLDPSAVYVVDPGRMETLPNLTSTISPDYILNAANGVAIRNYESNHLLTPEGFYGNWLLKDFIRSTSESVVTSSDPAKIVAGGNLTLNSNKLSNDNSQVLVGGTLLGDAGAVTNEETWGKRIIQDVGTITDIWRAHGDGHDSTGGRASPYNVTHPIQSINISTSQVLEHVAPTGSGTTIDTLNTGSVTATGAAVGTVNANNALQSTGSSINVNTNTTVNAINTTEPTLIKTGAVNTQMPNSSLFTVNPNNSGYYIQTDPRFANYRNWLSSDWMLNALKFDPANMHKRLGDGYYEQKLIKEQIAQLTGRRYLGDYHNDDTQYQALMQSGVTFAGQYNLRPGVALTAEQMARLTSDIVWLVEQEVTLPNGTKTTALVPKVYVAVKPGDIDGSGALISANSIQLNLTGDLNNAGTVSGRNVTQITAQNINNQGRINANQLDLQATNDLNNIGGTLDANTSASIRAGRDINVTTTTNSASSQFGSQTAVNRVAGIYVGDGANTLMGNIPANTLVIQAGNNVNLTAAQIDNAGIGNTVIKATQGDVNLSTVKLANTDTFYRDARNGHSVSETADVGSNINGVGNVTLSAGRDINAKAADVNSDKGTLAAVAGRDINLTTGQATRDTVADSYEENSGFLSSKKTTIHTDSSSNSAIGSNFTGNTVVLDAGHDANIVGSNVVSDTLTSIHADNDVNILAATNTESSNNFKEVKKSGLMGTGGIGFMVGKTQNSTDADHTNTSNAASNVGSLNGNVNLSAGNHYQQTGSNVTAGHADAMGQFVSAGDVNITAKDVDIVAGQDTYATDTVTKSKQSGLTVAVNVPIVNAVMAVADTAQTVGQSKNSRVNAMSAANTAMAGYQAANALSDLAKSGMNSVKDLNVSVSITVGSSQSKSETHAKGTEAVASTIVGNNVTITATGGGENSNIHVIGSEIAGTHATTLKADNNVTLESAQSISEEHSSNKSSGWNAGVAIGTQGIGFTFGGNYGKGHGDGTSVTQVNSHVGSSTGTTTIVAGDTTTLAGAQVLGNQVNIDTQNLAIESRQDTAQYDSKQMNISGQATIGVGASVSGSFSNSNTHANYASVNEQSGIMAGDGGYDINVKDHTDLKGGIITSTQAAEDAGRNQMSTGTLTASNIQNHADYDASGFGISGGVELGKAGSGGTDKDTGKNLGVGTDNRSLGVNKSLGYGADAGHNANTTVSGINTQNLTITNTAGQAQLMGKPADTPAAVIAEAVKQSIATSTTTDQVQANSGAIANNFDKDAVQSEIDLQIKVTQQFDTTRQQAKTIVNTKIDGLNKDIKALEDAKTAGTITADQDKLLTKKLAERNNWQIGGSIVDSIASGLSGPTSTGAAGILANAAAPQLQYQIGQYFKGTDAEGSTAHILAHTILAAATAAAGGNDALMAGLAAGGAEAVAPAVANWLFGSNPDVKKDAKDNVIASELTADQKNTLSNIIGLGTAGVTDLAGGSVTDVVSSTGLAQTAVEDNALKPQDLTAYLELALKYPKWNNKDGALFNALFRKDDDNAKLAMSVYEEIQSGQPLSEKAKANLEKLQKAFGTVDELKSSMTAIIASAEFSNQEWHSSGGKAGLSDADFMNLKNTFQNTFNTDGELFILDQVLSYAPNKQTTTQTNSNLSSNGFDITKDTKPPVWFSFLGINVIDNNSLPDVGILTPEQLYQRAAQNGLSPQQLDAWMKTLPNQDKVCGDLSGSDRTGCNNAYVQNMTHLINAYPGVPVSELSNQLNTVALLSQRGDRGVGELAWDATGQFLDLAATSNKIAAGLATGKTVIDLTNDVYKGFKQTPGAWEKFGYDVASETSKQMIEVVVEKEYPNFKQLPKSQQDILIKSVQNALGIIYKQNEPKISWGN